MQQWTEQIVHNGLPERSLDLALWLYWTTEALPKHLSNMSRGCFSSPVLAICSVHRLLRLEGRAGKRNIRDYYLPYRPRTS